MRRTAKENDGKPLGASRFKKETGIGPYEWMKFWPRFGDALQEAGLKPNEAWTRYPDELLVKQTIKKIRKYRKWPSIGELFVEFNKGDAFPFHIFKKRSYPYMVEKVIEYCRGKRNYKDILAICEPLMEKLDEKEEVDSVNQKAGEVYLIKSGKNYKIGKTYDAVRRGNEIRLQLAEKMDLIHSMKTDDPSGVESYWHKRFQPKRKNGEWFDLSSSDVKAFKRWKRIY